MKSAVYSCGDRVDDHNCRPRPRLMMGGLQRCSNSLSLPDHFAFTRHIVRYVVVICLLANLTIVNSSRPRATPNLVQESESSLTSENSARLGIYTQFRQNNAAIVVKKLNRHKRTTTNGRCDRSGVQQLTSECQPCDTALVEPCQNGYTMVQNGTMSCTFEADGYGKLEGCQFVCETRVILISCCHGFYLTGNNCIECPGGYSSPCNDHGTCDLDTGICYCHGNFSGFACEECSEGYYGDTCAGACNCVHGVCDAGVEGSGVCSCFPGYQGTNCTEGNEACIIAGCHANASCIQIDNLINCSCNHGYEGNGYTCQEIDPCTSHDCGINANCYHIGPLQYNCTCKVDYHGDGRLCYPDNPCLSDNGGCPLDTSVCQFLSAGKSKCDCKEYYHLSGENMCELIDICINASACQSNAECYTITPGQSGCRCNEGYIGTDTCYGNVMQRLREMNINIDGPVHQQLTTGIELLEVADFGVMLSSITSYFTLLIPNEGAFDRMDQQLLDKARNDIEFARYLMKMFIIPIQLDSQNLINAGHVFNLLGFQAEVFFNEERSEFEYSLVSETKIATIVTMNLFASNGVIHVVNEVLFTNPPVASNTTITLYEKISEEDNYQQFKKFLDILNVEFLQESGGPYTVFVPVNQAFENLTEDELQFLLSDQGRVKLQKIIENHIISDAQVPIDTFLTQRRLVSLSGSHLDLFVSSRGELEVSSQSTITLTDVLARNGIIHEVSHLIIPDDVQPLVPAWCNTTSYQTIQGICGSCIENERLICPAGSVKVNNDTIRGCLFIYQYGDIELQQVGCSLLCNQTIITPTCCDSFYGASCMPCPGGFLQPCLNNGECTDGISGNGSCICQPQFMGTSCEVCSNATKFGADCNKDCTCLHGVCDNGVSGSGHCKGDCYEGYQGIECQYQVETCGEHFHCHAHAQCQEEDGIIRCICLYGYEPDGLDCVAINDCSKPTQSQCSSQADCVYDGPGRYHCECEPNYEGDGMACTPVDPCTQPSMGNCHQHALCVYTTPGQNICECNEGFIGDGFECSYFNSCTGVSCHPQATCEDIEGMPHCICGNGYHGDGIVCYSNIAIEIAGNPLLIHFNELLMKSSLQHELAGIVNYTVFPAEDGAFLNINVDYIQDSVADTIIRNHVVQGLYTYNDLKDFAIQGEPLVSLNNQNISLTYSNMTLQVNEACIIVNDEPAVNGILHLINQVFVTSNLLDPTPGVLHGPGDILQVLSHYPYYSRIKEMLNNTGVARILQELDSYTMFIPDNTAVMGINLSESDLKYSIISGQKLYFEQLNDGLRLETMLGKNYDVIISAINSSMVLVNRIAIVETDIETNNGIVHGMEAVIHIYRSRCDTDSTIITKTQCAACSEQEACPQDTENGTVSECTYVDNQHGVLGCEWECIQHKQIVACCSGFYGDSCDECPGGWAMPCSNHGDCSQGIMGTGECDCEPDFQGFACELCQDNLFGSNCDQVCNCSNGRCNAGRDGDGLCICYSGWTGPNCHNVDVNGTCSNCHISAYCDSLNCVCTVGFTGNGTHCEAINLCDSNNGNCSQHALCTPLPQGSRECNCNHGYQGDGIVCQEINPCLHEHGGCHEYADCIHTGPDKSICNCKTNYTGDGVNSCRWVNPCSTNNGGCSIRATCQLTGANMRTCTCFEHHMGDGFICTGNIAEELALNPHLTTFNRIIQTNELHNLWLSVQGPYTILAPHNSAFDSLKSDQVAIWQENDQTADIVDYLTQGCAALNVSQLEQMRNITTANGQKLNIALKDSVLILNDIGKITSSIMATNGIIHIIDTVLTPDIAQNQNSTLKDCLLLNNYTTLVNMMMLADMFDILDDPVYKPFTIFAPSNQAFSNLPSDKKQQFENNVDILQEYLQYHVVADKKIRLSEMVLSAGDLSLISLQGSTLSAGCGEDIGDGYVNMDTKILQSNVMFSDGVAFGIDAVLEPPSIGGRCDEVTYDSMKSLCQDCAVQFTCPEGYKIVGDVYTDCYYQSGWYQTERGCQVDCVQRHVIHRCCTHYFGQDCFACPGGDTPCNNHGDCNDGIDGNGNCECHGNYQGDACQSCLSQYYGPQCTMCFCSSHGICEDGVSGSGSCFCLEGWTGDTCDEQISPTPACSRPCHENAVCRPGNKCECLPQYDGDGWNCTEKHLCAYLNGQCSSFATCVQTEGRVECTCITDYEGNGWSCNAVNPCLSENGKCHVKAHCTPTGPNQRSCSCVLPYLGDGIDCTIPSSTPSTRGPCSSDNGGCSENADCQEFPPTETNPYGSRQCQCRTGYVGNGTLCNGHVYDTLATIPQFSQFYRAVVDYGNSDFQHLLENSQSQLTVFVPINSDSAPLLDLLEDVGNHIVSGLRLTSDHLTTTRIIDAYSGLPLTIRFKAEEMTVNEVIVEEVDIPATNGVLHAIKFPLSTPSVTTLQPGSPMNVSDDSMTRSRLFAGILITFTILCVIGISSLLIIRYTHLRKLDGGFAISSKFKKKNNDDGGIVYFSNTRNPADNAFVNPSFSELGEDSVNIDKTLGTVSDA